MAGMQPVEPHAPKIRTSLKTYRGLSIEGCNREWKILKEHDVIGLDDGRIFVQLSVQNTSLSRLIGNDQGSSCLTRSIGYQKLLKLRNSEALRLWHEEEVENAATLFDDTPTPSRRRSRKQIKDDRDQHRSMSVNVQTKHGACAVEILRPSLPRDKLFVRWEQDTMDVIISYIKSEGFAGEKKRRTTDLPKGVDKHAKGYLVM
jgi:hypothetical protein